MEAKRVVVEVVGRDELGALPRVESSADYVTWRLFKGRFKSNRFGWGSMVEKALNIMIAIKERVQRVRARALSSRP